MKRIIIGSRRTRGSAPSSPGATAATAASAETNMRGQRASQLLEPEIMLAEVVRVPGAQGELIIIQGHQLQGGEATVEGETLRGQPLTGEEEDPTPAIGGGESTMLTRQSEPGLKQVSEE